MLPVKNSDMQKTEMDLLRAMKCYVETNKEKNEHIFSFLNFMELNYKLWSKEKSKPRS